MQAFSDPSRRNTPQALPDIEIFHVDIGTSIIDDDAGRPLDPGYYWWVCLPGCLPDSRPFGPFPSAHEAEADAVAYHADYLD